VYLFATIILSRKDELLELDPVEDADMLHYTLQKLPQPLDLDALINQTVALHAQHPPEKLPSRAWRRISANSMLKTTRDPTALSQQSLEDGQVWFEKQSAELRRQQAIERVVTNIKRQMYKYRRPVLLGVTVTVGVVAFWLGRSNGMERFWVFGVARLGWSGNLFSRFTGASAQREL
jgi:hypothetical protein